MSINCKYCRKFKAKDIFDSNINFEKKEQLTVEGYNDATVLPVLKKENDATMFGRGGVLTEANQYVILSALPGRVEGTYEPTGGVHHSEKCVVYGGFFIKHWGHFLLESIARLWYVLEYDMSSVDSIVFVSEFGKKVEIDGNYRKFLELLGVLDKVEIIAEPTTYKTVIVPELSLLYRKYYSEQFKNIFDTVSEKALRIYSCTDNIPNKLFFSRREFKKAKSSEVGLEMLDNYFAINGFSVISPEKMSLEEMIFFIRNADICVFPSGTVSHNMLFAADGQNAVIIERQSVVNNYQCNVDKIKELNVTYIDGHFTIYPTTAGGGPFAYWYNEYFQKYAKDNHHIPPSDYYISQKYLKKSIKRYMDIYHRWYGQNWGLEKWMLDYDKALYEGYEESKALISKYLTGEKIYSYKQLLDLRVLKIQVRKLLTHTNR